ncbi:MAG: hypothetical protein ACOX5Z_06525 [Desulfobulbus sp.]
MSPASPADGPPADLVRARIRERRILEARFLCRQLADRLEEEERAALEQEVAELLAQAEDIRLQARHHMAAGRYREAMQLYDELEAVAVDMPGVAEERKSLDAAESLAVRMAAGSAATPASPTAEEPAAAEPAPLSPEQGLVQETEPWDEPVLEPVFEPVEPFEPIDESGTGQAASAAEVPRRRRRFALFPHGVLALLLVAVVVGSLLVWRGARRYFSPESSPLIPQVRQEIRIQPQILSPGAPDSAISAAEEATSPPADPVPTPTIPDGETTTVSPADSSPPAPAEEAASPPVDPVPTPAIPDGETAPAAPVVSSPPAPTEEVASPPAAPAGALRVGELQIQ